VVEEENVVVFVQAMEHMKNINAILHLDFHMVIVPIALTGNSIFELCDERIRCKWTFVCVAVHCFGCHLIRIFCSIPFLIHSGKVVRT
jgi:hypothetical protein